MTTIEFRTSSLFESSIYSDRDMEKNEEMLERILAHINKGGANAFWLQFRDKALKVKEKEGHVMDAQYLLHSNVYYIRDFLEEHDDQVGLNLLDELERDCF